MRSSFIAVLAIAALYPAATAFATTGVSLVGVSIDPSEAYSGQQVTITVVANRTGSGCTNNWGYTKFFLDGNQIGTSTIDAFTGTGFSTSTFQFPATGGGEVEAELWSGAEDFAPANGVPDCTDTFIDSGSVVLEIKAAEESSKKVYSATSGGGGLCNPASGHPECQHPANFAYFAQKNKADEASLYQQLADALQKWLAMLQ